MQHPASERSIMDSTTVHKSGKVGADLLALAVDFVAEEGADRAELGLDSFVVVLRGIKPRHECGRAELMAREMDGDAGHACGTTAACERGGCRSNANSRQSKPPVVALRDHPCRPPELRGGLINRIMPWPSVGAPT